MARVLIVEEDNYRIFVLKKALEADGHEVSVNMAKHIPTQAHGAGGADLVLINWTLGNGKGWDVFNGLKDKDNKMALMLYALEDRNLGSVQWLRRSVREALACSQKQGQAEKARSSAMAHRKSRIRLAATVDGIYL
jgi:DNA-binding response OmpR family regulator